MKLPLLLLPLLTAIASASLQPFDLPLNRKVINQNTSRGRRLDPFDTDIDTIGEQIAFTTQMYFGSAPAQSMELLVDTGSSWTWVGLTDCSIKTNPSKGCEAGYFRYKDSNTFKKGNTYKRIVYGKGEADGYISTDSLFFDEKLTMGLLSAYFVAVDPVQAKNIKESSDLWQLQQLTGNDYVFDGIMGMSNIDESSGDMVMKQIFDNNSTRLDNFQFSLLIAPKLNQESMMTIGGYRSNHYNNSDYPLVSHSVSGSFHWSLHLVRYKLNGKWFQNKASAALIDSGSSDLLLPAEDLAIFLNEFHTDLPKGVEMHRTKKGTYYYTNCTNPSVFSDIDLQIDDHVYAIPAVFFITSYEGICYNKIGLSADKFWVLGVVFLQAYYQVYDLERNQVTLAPNNYVEQMFHKEIWVEHQGDNKVLIIVSIVIGLIVSFISQVCQIKGLKKGKEESEMQDLSSAKM